MRGLGELKEKDSIRFTRQQKKRQGNIPHSLEVGPRKGGMGHAMKECDDMKNKIKMRSAAIEAVTKSRSSTAIVVFFLLIFTCRPPRCHWGACRGWVYCGSVVHGTIGTHDRLVFENARILLHTPSSSSSVRLPLSVLEDRPAGDRDWTQASTHS